MKLIFTFLLFSASVLAQQPNRTYTPTNATNVAGDSNVPTCEPKYEFAGSVLNENLVAENRCLPRLTLVSLKEWDELKSQVAELQARVHQLEATFKADASAADKQVENQKKK
jgi:hypothetical protein